MTDPYDADRFRALGHQIVDLLADHLQRSADRERPVLAWQEPGDKLASVPPLPAALPGGPLALVQRLIAESNHLHHARFLGHQVNPPQPDLALFELVGSLLNNGMAVYEMGPLQTALEQRAIEWMARRLGLPDTADGVLTHGGSLGNLTALLAARQVQTRGHWQSGGHQLAVLASDQAHYSIDRAVRILGWGDGGCERVATDAALRLRPDDLPHALARARAAGRQVIAVVASACSTATGAFDPLPPIADFCASHGLWLHVDGAHGASLCLSPRHRHLLAGIERADSVVWDAHKLLQVPALCTGVLFRDRERSYAAFAQQASYLFGQQAPREDHNRGQRTLECTKRALGVLLYAALCGDGEARARQYVEHCQQLAADLAALVREADDFELAGDPQGNIVCYRYRPPAVGDLDDLDDLQQRIRHRLLREGRFYIVQTRLPQGLFLRSTLISARTTTDDLRAMLAAIRAAAND